MKQFLQILIFLCLSITTHAQSNLEAKALYQVAEEKFDAKQYTEALNYLNKSEEAFGKSNPDIAYLRVMVVQQALKDSDDKLKAFSMLNELEKAIDKFENTKQKEALGEDKQMAVMRIKIELPELKRKYETPEMQYKMAKSYKEGKNGFEKDEKLYDEWIVKASENGYSDAQYDLAIDYAFKKDYEKTKYWLSQAVEDNNVTALNAMGYFYKNGLCGFSKDYIKADEWYKKTLAVAIKQEDEFYQIEALASLGELYYLPDNKQATLTIDYYEKAIAVRKDNYKTRITLATIYYADAEVKDYAKATQYLEEAFTQLSAEAAKDRDAGEDLVKFVPENAYKLIDMYTTGGNKLKKNAKRAAFWQNIKDSTDK